VKKYTYISLPAALLLLATLTGCPVQDSDDDSGESGSDPSSTATSSGSSGAASSTDGT